MKSKAVQFGNLHGEQEEEEDLAPRHVSFEGLANPWDLQHLATGTGPERPRVRRSKTEVAFGALSFVSLEKHG